jgi:glycosyltransferase involved in cell wall biosynthesis/ubiquinone/menaquinone biosynthesis C-methylase UbiE
VGRITLFCTPSKLRLFDLPSSDKLAPVEKPWVDANYVLRVLWYEWLLGIECIQRNVDVVFVSANFGCARFGVPHVTYIRQSLPFSKEALATLPRSKMRFKSRFYRWQMRRSCRKAARIICQSSVMKEWVTTAFALDPKKVEAIYYTPKDLRQELGSCLAVNTGAPTSASGRLLYVGSDYSYKRLNTALTGMDLLRRRIPSAELALTLPKDHAYHKRSGVTCLGYLDDEALGRAYRASDVVILPSLVESGPQPPVEAMSLGIPVLIADRPYAHDICEDAALFFDPHGPQDFAEKAIQMLTDEGLRRDLISKGLALVERRRAADPYKQMIQILLDAVDGRSPGFRSQIVRLPTGDNQSSTCGIFKPAGDCVPGPFTASTPRGPKNLKSIVKAHWEKETCGTRYGSTEFREQYFDEISCIRYELEPYILEFADFRQARSKKVLEVGVGAGSDFNNWVKNGAIAVGIDITDTAIALTSERLELSGANSATYGLSRADAEALPFDDNHFDIVYSWGVFHHTPDTERAFREAFRVLKRDGVLKVMVYHVRAWSCWMLWVRYALFQARPLVSVRTVVFEHLESPGTKAYTVCEAQRMLSEVGFRCITTRTKLGPGDLLMIKPSKKYQHPLYDLVRAIYPRWLIKRIGDRFGLYLCIEARKPDR